MTKDEFFIMMTQNNSLTIEQLEKGWEEYSEMIPKLMKPVPQESLPQFHLHDVFTIAEALLFTQMMGIQATNCTSLLLSMIHILNENQMAPPTQEGLTILLMKVSQQASLEKEDDLFTPISSKKKEKKYLN